MKSTTKDIDLEIVKDLIQKNEALYKSTRSRGKNRITEEEKKQRRKAYSQLPEVKLKRREYNKRPYVKLRRWLKSNDPSTPFTKKKTNPSSDLQKTRSMINARNRHLMLDCTNLLRRNELLDVEGNCYKVIHDRLVSTRPDSGDNGRAVIHVPRHPNDKIEVIPISCVTKEELSDKKYDSTLRVKIEDFWNMLLSESGDSADENGSSTRNESINHTGECDGDGDAIIKIDD